MSDSTPISDELVASLAAITNLNEARCKEYLTATNGDLEAAAQAYFADADEGEAQATDSPAAATATTAAAAAATAGSSQSVPDNYTGPRTLDGRPAPQAIPTTTSRSAAKKPQKKTGLATLSSIGGGHAHDDDDDDDDDEFDPRDPRNTYAGGEKSGLAVQDPSQRSSDPKKLLNDLLAKARSNAPRSGAESPGPSRAGPSAFSGSGQTLGGEGTASRVIPDPDAPPAGSSTSTSSRSRPQSEQAQERTLHIWQDGFSIDDGELHRFDDPANAADLRMIQQGRAPIHLMNVRFDEPLDVKLQQHAENWHQLPKVYKPFGGEGRRLGSPVPGDSSPSAATALPTVSTSNTAAAAPTTTTGPPSIAVDESRPSVLIRLQMLDGSRLPARFNTTQTVGDIYDFITRASPELRAGGWVLATTFPNREHTDKSLVIGDMAEFKKGGTAVVKRSTS